MGIKRAHLFVLSLVALISTTPARGQTIPLKKNGNLYLKFARTDSLKRNQFDLTRVVDWQFDTTGKVFDQKWTKEIDWNRSIQPFVWMASDQFTYYFPRSPSTPLQTQPNGLILPNAKLAFFILGNIYNVSSEFDVLTVWDLIGSDSIRFRCAALTDYFYFNGTIKVVKGGRFPDSSLFVYLQGTAEGTFGYAEDNRFYRMTSSCDLQLIYGSSWNVEFDRKYKQVHYKVESLGDHGYQFSETADFGRRDFATGRGMVVDSSRTRIIDLWELAKKQPQIEAPGR